jgi:hypothetical protein
MSISSKTSSRTARSSRVPARFFHYSANEQLGLSLTVSSYPHDGTALQRWLRDLYHPGQPIDTFDLLNNLLSLSNIYRLIPIVQRPFETPFGQRIPGDYAVLMMEAARHWGFGAQFVTGYVQMGEGQHGATHAWTEIYIPERAGRDSIHECFPPETSTSRRRGPSAEDASPLSGFWDGPADAFERMEAPCRSWHWKTRRNVRCSNRCCSPALAWIERRTAVACPCAGAGLGADAWLPAVRLAWAPRGILPTLGRPRCSAVRSGSLLWIAASLMFGSSAAR